MDELRELEMRYLDEYKRLEPICNDMFSCRNGVSAYIAEMEQTPQEESGMISEWWDDYDTLKRLRRLRNHITHEPTDSGCSQEDMERLRWVYNRMLNQQDSLAILYWMRQDNQRRWAAGPPDTDRSSRGIASLAVVIAGVLFLTALFLSFSH